MTWRTAVLGPIKKLGEAGGGDAGVFGGEGGGLGGRRSGEVGPPGDIWRKCLFKGCAADPPGVPDVRIWGFRASLRRGRKGPVHSAPRTGRVSRKAPWRGGECGLPRNGDPGPQPGKPIKALEENPHVEVRRSPQFEEVRPAQSRRHCRRRCRCYRRTGCRYCHRRRRGSAEPHLGCRFDRHRAGRRTGQVRRRRQGRRRQGQEGRGQEGRRLGRRRSTSTR